MLKKFQIIQNMYYDSVTLMALSSQISTIDGINDAAIMMATDQNLDIMKNAGLIESDFEASSPNDLVIAIKSQTEEALESALSKVDDFLLSKEEIKAEKGEVKIKSLDAAVQNFKEANLVFISVPGVYAKREAMKALNKDLHVHLFSDNVSIEDEVELKDRALEKGLLMMGPDCGTSIINGIGVGFANKVKRGNIGIVAAAGTGLQEVATQISKRGEGVSQAIGTGGRDIQDKVGGKMVIAGLEALIEDEDTRVIVLVSKPPEKSVVDKLKAIVESSRKPVVACLLGSESADIKAIGAVPALTLEDAAEIAVSLLEKREAAEVLFSESEAEINKIVEKEAGKLKPEQKYIRGLYTGGTLNYEAMLVLRDYIGDIYSNGPLAAEYKLEDSTKSKEHTFIDLGEDEFTVGRPHPMIDPSQRNERIVEEAKDPETAVILADVVIGYGSHEDPAGSMIPSIKEAQEIARADGRYVSIIASVCGTEEDPQILSEQEKTLRDAGVTILPSNSQAARLAGLILTKSQ